MTRWLKWLFGGLSAGRTAGTKPLPTLPRESIRHLFELRHGLPQVDWGLADLWLKKHHPDDALMRRAVAAAWLEELRDALTQDHQAWRTAEIEGLTPLDGLVGRRVMETSRRSFAELTRSLAPIRGRVPVPPCAVVGLGTGEAYYSFLAHFYPEEGEFATSGGSYIRASSGGVPILALNLASKHDVEATVAHELTHHALVDCELPLWIEEGLTQMMEERVVGTTNYNPSKERIARIRDRWAGQDLDEYLRGESFFSSHGDDQELAYLLSQWIVRRCLEDQPKQFFAFLRECRTLGVEDSCHAHMGSGTEATARRVAGIPAEGDDD